ncbi:MAG: peptidylprolyl isomerase [Pirellulaceae bacterium]|nr:peptidylprolyl isomerase [Pirellulaceae bacterium]
MQPALRLVTFAVLALALRAATAQVAPPQTAPAERGDPYAPRGGATEARYPLPGPAVAPGPGSYAAPPPAYGPAPQPPASTNLPPPSASSPPAAAGEFFEPTKIMATVGDQYIFYGDVAPLVNMILEPYRAKMSPAEFAQFEAKNRSAANRQVVAQLMEAKLLYLEFDRTIVKNTKGDQKKLGEIRTDMQKRMLESFEKELAEMRPKVNAAKPDEMQELIRRDSIIPRVALLMRDNQVESLGELDTLLRRYGSSLDKQVRAYGEDRLGRQMISKALAKKHEVTYLEMADYYRLHAEDFALAAKAKYEILTVKFVNFPDKGAAYNTIAQMGNEVYFGAPFAAIARKHSQEPNAAKGGAYDWTTQGSLASEIIDRAIFTLEPGKLSQIIEDATGYHIVRVTERQEAGSVSFVEAQPKIKEALLREKRQADYQKYIERVRTGTPLWSIYDDEEAAALARQQAAGGGQR